MFAASLALIFIKRHRFLRNQKKSRGLYKLNPINPDFTSCRDMPPFFNGSRSGSLRQLRLKSPPPNNDLLNTGIRQVTQLLRTFLTAIALLSLAFSAVAQN